MEEIVEHFGIGFLELIGALGAVVIFIDCLEPGGILYTAVMEFMSSIGG